MPEKRDKNSPLDTLTEQFPSEQPQEQKAEQPETQKTVPQVTPESSTEFPTKTASTSSYFNTGANETSSSASESPSLPGLSLYFSLNATGAKFSPLHLLARFIQHETELIASTLGGPEPMRAPAELDPEVAAAVDAAADPHRKLALLLAYHPAAVSPQVYIHYYSMVPDPDDTLVQGLVSRLAWHRQFDMCWAILPQTAVMLTEIDEFLDVICTQIDKMENSPLWVHQMLVAAGRLDQTVLHLVLDAVCHRYALERQAVEAFLEEVAAFESIDQADVFQKVAPKGLRAAVFYVRRAVQLAADPAPVFAAALAANPHLLQPGLLSFVISTPIQCFPPTPGPNSKLPSTDTFRDLAENILAQSCELGDYDCYHLVQLFQDKIPWLYDTISQNRHLPSFPYLLNCILLATSDTKITDSVVKSDAKLVNKTFFPLLLKTLFKTSKKAYASLMATMDGEKEIVAAFVDDVCLAPDPKEIALLLQTVPDQALVLRTLRTRNITSDYTQLFTTVHFHRAALMEFARYALLDGADGAFAAQVFKKILSKCWKVDDIFGRNPSYASDNKFHTLFVLASRKEHKTLHNYLRAFAQLVSILDQRQATSILISIHQNLTLDKSFVQTTKGRDYIFNHLIDNLTSFVMRKHKQNPKQGIQTLKSMFDEFNFDFSRNQSIIYRLMVTHDPEYAFKILDSYKHKKSLVNSDLVESVLLGILNTPLLDDYNKILTFNKFKKHQIALNFKESITTETAIKLGDLVVKVTVNDPRKSKHDAAWILDYAWRKKVPRKILGSWSKKLKKPI